MYTGHWVWLYYTRYTHSLLHAVQVSFDTVLGLFWHCTHSLLHAVHTQYPYTLSVHWMYTGSCFRRKRNTLGHWLLSTLTKKKSTLKKKEYSGNTLGVAFGEKGLGFRSWLVFDLGGRLSSTLEKKSTLKKKKGIHWGTDFRVPLHTPFTQ